MQHIPQDSPALEGQWLSGPGRFRHLSILVCTFSPQRHFWRYCLGLMDRNKNRIKITQHQSLTLYVLCSRLYMFSCVLVGSMSATAHSHDSQALSSFHFSSLCCDVNIWRCWCSIYGLAAQEAAARDLIIVANTCLLVKWVKKCNTFLKILQHLKGNGFRALAGSGILASWSALSVPRGTSEGTA